MLDVEAHIIAAVHLGRWPIFLVMLYPRRNAASGPRAKGRPRILQFPGEDRPLGMCPDTQEASLCVMRLRVRFSEKSQSAFTSHLSTTARCGTASPITGN